MRVTKSTKYAGEFADLEPYISERTKQQLTAAAEKTYGGMYDLEIGTLWKCMNDDFSFIGIMTEKEYAKRTVYQHYWIKRFNTFCDEFANILKRLTLKQTADEQRASSGLIEVNWCEGLLVFAQSYFGLKSFREAEKVTLGDIVIAKRATYNRELFNRKLAEIQTQKYKKK